MKQGYLYLASDGIKDFYKFGITNCLNTRLISYNTTEHLRPISFLETYFFKTYDEARNIETQLKSVLKNFIVQSNHDETFKVCDESLGLFYDVVKNNEKYIFNNKYVGNIKNESFPYVEKVTELVNEYISLGFNSDIIEKMIIKHKIGYYRENANPRIVMENRIKDLISINGRMICWDNKPKHSLRMSRYYNLVDDLKTKFKVD